MFIYQWSNARSITKLLQFQLLTNTEYLQQTICPYTLSSLSLSLRTYLTTCLSQCRSIYLNQTAHTTRCIVPHKQTYAKLYTRHAPFSPCLRFTPSGWALIKVIRLQIYVPNINPIAPRGTLARSRVEQKERQTFCAQKKREKGNIHACWKCYTLTIFQKKALPIH